MSLNSGIGYRFLSRQSRQFSWALESYITDHLCLLQRPYLLTCNVESRQEQNEDAYARE